MFDGNGGWFSTDIPDTVKAANKKAEKADGAYRESIRLSGGAPAASISTAFYTKSVSEDVNSGSAYSEFKKEKSNVEKNIESLTSQIKKLNAEVEDLNKKIKNCNAQQDRLESKMRSYLFEMTIIKKLIY